MSVASSGRSYTRVAAARVVCSESLAGSMVSYVGGQRVPSSFGRTVVRCPSSSALRRRQVARRRRQLRGSCARVSRAYVHSPHVSSELRLGAPRLR